MSLWCEDCDSSPCLCRFHEEMDDLRSERDRALRALETLANKLGKPYKIGGDGTHIKCTCNREGCFDEWFSHGDLIFSVSYIHADDVSAALAEIAKIKGEK